MIGIFSVVVDNPKFVDRHKKNGVNFTSGQVERPIAYIRQVNSN